MRLRRTAVALGSAVVLVGCGPAGLAPHETFRFLASGSAASATAEALPAQTSAAVHPATPSSYQAEAGQTFLVDQEPSNWNPHAATADGPAAASAISAVGQNNVVGADPLLDEILSPVLPSVFEVDAHYKLDLNTTFVQSAVQTSSDPQTIVYQINPQAVWSDGTAITYQDFVYNWQSQSGSAAYLDVGGQPYQAASTDGYRQIASVSELGGDPYRVKVVFKSRDPDWRSLFSLLLPAHVAQRVGFDTGFTDPVQAVSGGPFEIQSYVAGSSITLVRNPRYWGSPANLAEVTFRFVTDPNQTVPTLEAGDAGAAAPEPAPGLKVTLTRAVSAHPLVGETLAGYEVDDVAGPVWEHLDFNEANPLLANVAVRRAIMMAVNRTQLIAATIGRDDPSVRPLGSLVFVPGQLGYRNDAGVYGTGNVAGARTALEQAGYTYRGPDLTEAGRPVSLRITGVSTDPLVPAEEKVIATQLSAIGITATDENSPDLLGTLRSGEFDLALVESEASPFISTVADRYQSNNGGGQGADNFDDYSSLSTNALLIQAEAAPSPAALRRLGDKLDGQLWSDAVSLPLYQEPQLLVYDKVYLNMVDSPVPGGLTANMAKWGVASTG